MKTCLYRYVVIRIMPSSVRGEQINVGFVIFSEAADPVVVFSANLAKIRAIDPRWTESNSSSTEKLIYALMSSSDDVDAKIAALVDYGYCMKGKVGSFYSSPARLNSEIEKLTELYVQANKRSSGTRKNRLHTIMKNKFKGMDVLGKDLDDLDNHKIVPNVSVPNYADLKCDFVYRNGVYRLTQTFDYNVADGAAHQKISEICTKLKAGEKAQEEWGDSTKKLALFSIPDQHVSVAKSHMEMLQDSRFEIFDANDDDQLHRYTSLALAM